MMKAREYKLWWVWFALTAFAGGCTTQNTSSSLSYPTDPAEERLRLAQAIPPDAAPGSIYEFRVYLVQPGDTAAKILERFHLTEQELTSLNPGIHPRLLKIKERLVIYERISQ